MATPTYSLRFDTTPLPLTLREIVSDISVILAGDTSEMTKTEDALAVLRVLGGIAAGVEAEIKSVARSAVSGATWQEIGEALGISRQAAHKRFSRL